ncbi:MAG: ATP-binding cassette domain-containing protein [Desulfobacteraceae bacterium]|nr:ATP-binding cassette domain-containing protein [Desulfobacteraceae bacterium]
MFTKCIQISGGKKDSGPIITIEHLSVAYGRKDILHDVSLKISQGLFLPFIGPNGGGKTTLLRAILGLIRPRKGKVQTPFRRASPGYVPQHKSIDPLYPVTTRQIVMMGLYPELGPWRRPNTAQNDRLRRVLEQFDLTDHAHKTFGELSGGMKQKTLVARAVIGSAEVLVLDEPTSDLDEQSEKEVLSQLFRLCEREGKTVLLAHHGLNMVAGLTSTICLVDHGSVRLFNVKDLPEGLNSSHHDGPRSHPGKGDK